MQLPASAELAGHLREASAATEADFCQSCKHAGAAVWLPTETSYTPSCPGGRHVLYSRRDGTAWELVGARVAACVCTGTHVSVALCSYRVLPQRAHVAADMSLSHTCLTANESGGSHSVKRVAS